VRPARSLVGGTSAPAQPAQIDAEKAFAKQFNGTNSSCILLELEIAPAANAYDVLKTEIAAGNAPDIIGPVDIKGMNSFQGSSSI